MSLMPKVFEYGIRAEYTIETFFDILKQGILKIENTISLTDCQGTMRVIGFQSKSTNNKD